MKVYQELSMLTDARNRCKKDGNEWQFKHEEKIQDIIDEYLPYGSGIDCSYGIDFDNSKKDKLIILPSFHVMDEHGGYDHWSDIKITITPSLSSNYNIKMRFIPFKDKMLLEDYLTDTFIDALDKEYIRKNQSKLNSR